MPYSDLMRQGPPDEFKKNFATLYDLTHGGVCPELYRTQKAFIVKKITQHKPENDYALEYVSLIQTIVFYRTNGNICASITITVIISYNFGNACIK